MPTFAAGSHRFYNEDSRGFDHPGYDVRPCVRCVAETVRLHPQVMVDVSFLVGNESNDQSCGRHGEMTAGNSYGDQAPPVG